MNPLDFMIQTGGNIRAMLDYVRQSVFAIFSNRLEVWREDIREIFLFWLSVDDYKSHIDKQIGEATGDEYNALILERAELEEAWTSIRIEFFDTIQSVSKFQFPKDLWSGKYKDPFRKVRDLKRGFLSRWPIA